MKSGHRGRDPGGAGPARIFREFAGPGSRAWRMIRRLSSSSVCRSSNPGANTTLLLRAKSFPALCLLLAAFVAWPANIPLFARPDPPRIAKARPAPDSRAGVSVGRVDADSWARWAGLRRGRRRPGGGRRLRRPQADAAGILPGSAPPNCRAWSPRRCKAAGPRSSARRPGRADQPCSGAREAPAMSEGRPGMALATSRPRPLRRSGPGAPATLPRRRGPARPLTNLLVR